MSAERRYPLQSEEANRRARRRSSSTLRVPEADWRHLRGACSPPSSSCTRTARASVDLKIANTALKEMRYGFKVFAPVPARAARSPCSGRRARPRRASRVGAGARVRPAHGRGGLDGDHRGGQRRDGRGPGGGGAGAVVRPQHPAALRAGGQPVDRRTTPSSITFKYFFTRKLFLVREAIAMAFFPGGFGTADEAFEALTLVQTGKAPMLPLVLVDAPGGRYWKAVSSLIQRAAGGARDDLERRRGRYSASPTTSTWRSPRSSASTGSSTPSASSGTISCSGCGGRCRPRRWRSSAARFDDILGGPRRADARVRSLRRGMSCPSCRA